MRSGNRSVRSDEESLPYFHPVPSEDPKHKYKVKVWDPFIHRSVIVSFGAPGYEDFTQHNDPSRRANYLARSGGIRDHEGFLTKDDVLSPNYWSRRYLWASGEDYVVYLPPGYT